MMSEPVHRFLGAVAHLKGDYRSIEARVVALRWRENWLNLATRVVLSPETIPRKHTFAAAPSDLPELLIDGDVGPIEHLPRFLEVFEKGVLPWKDTEVHYRRVERDDLGPPYAPRFRAHSRGERPDWIGLDTRCFVLEGGEGTLDATIGNDAARLLEAKIASLHEPFSGIGDLVRTYTGYGHLENTWSQCTLEIVAPVWAQLDSSCALERGRVVVRALLPEGHDPGKLNVGIIQGESGKGLRLSRERIGFELESRKGRVNRFLRAEARLLPTADRVELLLSYRDDLVDRLMLYRNLVSRSNPRMAVVSSVDPELARFRDGLRGQLKGKKGNLIKGGGFEEAFLDLLTFLGFSCRHIGRDEGQPDILAWATDPGKVFVVECTTDEPDLRNKATKFSARLRRIRLIAPGSEVVGVMATTLAGDVINTAERDRLAADQIILVDGDAIGALLELAEQGAAVGEALGVLQELASRQRLSLGGWR